MRGIDPRARNAAAMAANLTSNRTRQMVATNGYTYGGTNQSGANGLSNGTDTLNTFRIRHTATVNCCDLQFVYANYATSQNNGGDTALNASISPITVTASLDTGSTIFPLTFNGQTSVTIPVGGFAVSDPVGIEITSGTQFWSRTCVSVTSGQKYPLGIASYNGWGEGKTTGDITKSGTPTTGIAWCYSPTAILGTPQTPKPTFAFMGDSIMYGYYDGYFRSWADYGFDITGGNGYDFTNPTASVGYGFMNLSSPGEKATTFGTALSTNTIYRKAMLNLVRPTHAICEYGVNDFYQSHLSLSQVQTALQNVWQMLAQRGIKVYQTTITPISTSTDSFATLANQTPSADNANRIALNRWIRSIPSPYLSGYIEVANVVESAPESGIWAVAYAYDGLHPNHAGHSAIARTINFPSFSL